MMNEAKEPILLSRVWRTPMRDLVRLRVSGRLDWKHSIAKADLPDTTKTLLTKLVRKTRLWRLEKTQIANELIAHFQDALATGQREAQTTELFGDWKKTAKLIRRATKRKRSYVWHAWRWGFWFVAVFLGLYASYGVYLATGARNIAIDYTVMLNEKAAAVPGDERAWPVMRDALIAMGYSYKTNGSTNHKLDAADLIAARTTPADTDWPIVSAFLGEQASSVAELRRAGQMTGLGYLSAEYHAREDLPLLDPYITMEAYEKQVAERDAAREEQGPMSWSLTLNHGQAVRDAVRLLRVDTYRAVEAGDRDTAYANLVSMLGFSGMANEQGTMIGSLFGFVTYADTFETVSRIVVEHPDIFSNEQFSGLAHRIAAVRGYRPDVSGEQMLMLDLIQHIYTDDGDGNGYLDTHAWQNYSRNIMYSVGLGIPGDDPSDSPGIVSLAIAPAIVTIAADRKDMVATLNRLYELSAADMAVPMWKQPESKAEAAARAITEASLLRRMRYFLIALSASAPMNHGRETAERHTANSDGVLVGIALELYNREYGSYPESLDALVPRYLPEIPIDRITGGPLNYRVIEGRSVVYSVGADRDDDGGTVARDADGDRKRGVREWVVPAGQAPIDGDWVVWPLHD